VNETEAWLWLAALIEGTKGEAMVFGDGTNLVGLCPAIHLMRIDDVVSQKVADDMTARAMRFAVFTNGFRVLHTAGQWKDGSRRNWCLKFAEGCE
jgi:hypothetical protein